MAAYDIRKGGSIFSIAALCVSQSLAETGAPMSDTDTDLSKEIENPVTRRITLPLRYDADFLDGAYYATKDTFDIDQAVVPFQLNEDWALITRTKLPFEVEPPKKLGDHWANGPSNGYTTFFCRRSMARASILLRRHSFQLMAAFGTQRP